MNPHTVGAPGSDTSRSREREDATITNRYRRRRIQLLTAATAMLVTSSFLTSAAGMAAASVRPSTTISGVSMPVGNLKGWTQVMAENFNGPGIDTSRWSVYTGPDHANPKTHWRKQNAVVSGGDADLQAYYDPAAGYWTAAGMTSGKAVTQTYGRYEIRARSDRATGVPFVALLWPTTGWPPEIDFMEDPTGNRAVVTSTLHYDLSNKMIHRSHAVDLTAWHTYGVDWTPGDLKYTIDGTVWAEVRSSAVPSRPMVLDLQTEIGNCGAPGACTAAGQTVARSQIDWAVIYAYTP